jgi:hypothetical protein
VNPELTKRLLECIEQLICLHKCRESIDREIAVVCKQAVRVMQFPPLELVKS